MSQEHLSQLHQLLIGHFDEEELRTLCFNLGVEYDDLPSKGRANKARDLVTHLERRDRLPALIEICSQRRPSVSWEVKLTATPRARPQAGYSRPIDEGLVALTKLMQTAQVQDAVITFRADFQAACEQINVLSHCKQLHDSFQELENLYNIIDGERKRLATDQMAWEGLMLHEPELQGVIGDLLNVAGRAASVADDAWWTQQLAQARDELREAVENFEARQIELAARRLSRVLDREPSRINTRLVAAAGALRLTGLVKAMTTVQDSLTHPDLDLEAVRQFADGIDALAALDGNLAASVNDHNRWQEIDDELRRVETNLDQDTLELELAWPDLKSMGYALYGDSTADWAISLNEVGAKLEHSLAAGVPVKVKMLFLRYRSQASRRFQQVDSDLLTLCQDLQKIGASLDLLMRTIQ